MVEEYLTDLLGKESAATKQFIDIFINKWKLPAKSSPFTDQDTLLKVYHRPNDEELVLMAAKKPSAKHKKQEGNSSHQPQVQRRSVCIYCHNLTIYILLLG